MFGYFDVCWQAREKAFFRELKTPIRAITFAMKKLAVFAVVLTAVIVGVAVWYSPLAFSGASRYENNEAAGVIDGLYPEDATVRADYIGSEADMYAALDKMLAKPVFSAYSGGTLIVYAYSPRVCGFRTLGTGERYNVMAAYKNGTYALGTPVLEGSY